MKGIFPERKNDPSKVKFWRSCEKGCLYLVKHWQSCIELEVAPLINIFLTAKFVIVGMDFSLKRSVIIYIICILIKSFFTSKNYFWLCFCTLRKHTSCVVLEQFRIPAMFSHMHSLGAHLYLYLRTRKKLLKNAFLVKWLQETKTTSNFVAQNVAILFAVDKQNKPLANFIQNFFSKNKVITEHARYTDFTSANHAMRNQSRPRL